MRSWPCFATLNLLHRPLAVDRPASIVLIGPRGGLFVVRAVSGIQHRGSPCQQCFARRPITSNWPRPQNALHADRGDGS
jgi:hypothetical protein